MEVTTMKTKYTVITGASSGIGRAVALKFAERNKKSYSDCTKKEFTRGSKKRNFEEKS